MRLQKGGRKELWFAVVMFACAVFGTTASAQTENPVTKQQFESNLKLLFSYEIKEFTRGERLSVGAWDGGHHRVLRWARDGSKGQRFAVAAEGGKIRLRPLREDINDRIFVGIEPGGAAITWPRKEDGSQLFEVVWQPDGKTFALREGTKGEFVDVTSGGGAVRWSGVDGKNDKPKPNQVFQFLNPLTEGALAGNPLLAPYAGRRLGESCVGFVPCAAGLSCQPGVLKCFSVPRGENEACIIGGPFDCDVGLQCASPEQICTSVAKRTEGTYCDAVTYQCAEGFKCDFKWAANEDLDVGVPVPLAQTGRCHKGRGANTLFHPYSKEDSEHDPLYVSSDWLVKETCAPSQLLVGLMVDSNYYATVETTGGRRENWATLRNITPICVETNKQLTWAGPPIGQRQQLRDDLERLRGATSLMCGTDSYVKRITGTYGRDLFPDWKEGAYVYSLQVECTDGRTTRSVGGFANATNPASFDLTCPSWRFLPKGVAYNGQGFPMGGALKLKTSSELFPPARPFTQRTAGALGINVTWWETSGTAPYPDPLFTIFRDLVLDCGDAEQLKTAAEKARATPVATTPVPTGGGTRLGTLSGEIACNTYLNERRIRQEDNRPITESERLELCSGAADRKEAALRIGCFGDSLARKTPASRASFECSPKGGGPRVGINPAPTWPAEPPAWSDTAAVAPVPTATAPTTTAPAPSIYLRLDGIWTMYDKDGKKLDKSAVITQTGSTLTIDNGYGKRSLAGLQGNKIASVDGYPGTVSSDGTRIEWVTGIVQQSGSGANRTERPLNLVWVKQPSGTPALVPKGGGTRLGTLPGEIACNTYLNERRIAQEDNRPIQEAERLELCQGAADEQAAAVRIWCFGTSLARNTPASRASFDCGPAGNGPKPGSANRVHWPPSEPPAWTSTATAAPPTPRLEGSWTMYKANGEKFDRPARIGQSGPNLSINNGYGANSTAVLTGNVFATSDGLKGTVSADGTRIDWNIGIYWVRQSSASAPVSPTATSTPGSPPTSTPTPMSPPTSASTSMSPPATAGGTCDAAKENLCRSLVQGQIPWSRSPDPKYRVWDPANVDALCRCTANAAATVQCFQNALASNGNQWKPAIDSCAASAPTTVAMPVPTTPARAPAGGCDTALENSCKSLLQGQVPWTTAAKDDPSVRRWAPENLDSLCHCTTNPPTTVLCFQNALVSNGNSWRAAINSCKAP